MIGVSKYARLPKSDWLIGADADATALSQMLRSPRGGAFPADHVQLLVNEAATITNIRIALDRLIKHVRNGDVVYVFFAGHGVVEWYGGGEVAYLLPYDCDPDALNATALPMDELRRYVDVNLRHASQVVLITDACHAGGLGLPPDGQPKHAVSSVSDHLLDIGERGGVLNIMACRRDERAVEDARLGGHGVLTYTLLQALNGAGTTASDGTVRAQDVLEYVTRQVPRLTDQRQHPRHSSNYNDDFPMARMKLPGAAIALPPPPQNSLDAAASSTAVSTTAPAATLRVVGAPVNSELYLVQGGDQRTIGRVLEGVSVLVLDGIPPGRYDLVQSAGGRQSQWPITLSPGLQTVDVRDR